MSFGRNLERLDEALDVFEQGVTLVRENRELLMRAEQRVKILTREGEEPYDGAQIAGENEN